MREYDLLVGILACQLRLVSRGSLVRFSAAFTQSPGLSLLDYLVDSRALTESDQALLCRLTDTIIHAHHGDERAALKAFGGDDAATEAFAHSVVQTEQGWGPSEEQTVLAEHLPHGLPAQITPETIGRYTRGSEYARGGIGRILLVHDEQIGRDIILKELLPEHATSPTDSTLSRIPHPESPKSPMRQSAAMMARFLQEAKITGQLEHPSIVPVYELGTRSDGQLYYTMKLVRGDTLAVAIKNAKNPRDRLALLRNFLDVCQAMAYAHAKGVIHRDLKPSNIMVGEFGECVVLDWGLAKLQKDQDAHREAMEKTISQFRLGDDQLTNLQTRSKDVLGTPLYMAPEQARGEIDGIGPHSDVYSLGVILYEILSGELPHAWSNSMDTIRRVGAFPAPSIRKAAPETPPELAAICDKALAFHAKQRYASARELSSDIQRFLEGAVVDAYAYRVTDILRRLYRRHRAIINASLAAAAALLALGTFSYWRIYEANIKAEHERTQAILARDESDKQRDVAEAERKRAENAEERTAREKYVSDIRLADAYVRDSKFQAAEDTLLETQPHLRNIEWGYLAAKCNQATTTLRGHTADVFACLSPEASHILTTSSDGTAKLWGVTNPVALYTWTFPGKLISGATFSPDGKRIAIWMHDGRIHLINTMTGVIGPVWNAHAMRVHQCLFSADGQRIASTGDDRVVRFWPAEGTETIWESQPLDSPAYRIAFGKQDSRLIVCPEAAPPILLDTENGVLVKRASIAGTILWTEDDSILLLDGEDLVLLSGMDLSELQRISTGSGLVRAKYYPDSEEILTGSHDGTIVLWDSKKGAIKQTYNLRQRVHECRIDNGGHRVIAVSADGRICTFDKASGIQQYELGGHRNNITTVELAPDDTFLLTGSVDGTARQWSLSESAAPATSADAAPNLIPLSVSEGGKTIALGEMPGHVRVIDLEHNTALIDLESPNSLTHPVAAISKDTSLLAILLDGFLPAVISLVDGSVVATLHGHEGYITDIQFNPAGTELLTSSWDNTARIWEPKTGNYLGNLVGHKDTIHQAAFSKDGKLIATASWDQTAIIWDRESLAALFTIQHEYPIAHCDFSPDGRYVATCGRSGTIRVWDVEKRQERHLLKDKFQQISTVSFTHDGKRLVSESGRRSMSIWDAELGVRLADLDGGSEEIARWGMFHGLTDTIVYESIDNLIRSAVLLSSETAASIHDVDDLLNSLEAQRAARASRPDPSTQGATERPRYVYLPHQQVAALMLSLRDLCILHPASPTTWDSGGNYSLYPSVIRDGDLITSIAGLAPGALVASANEATLAPLLTGMQPFSLDLIRNGIQARYRVHGIPSRSTERSITLTPERAVALLQAAIDTIRSDASTLFEINQQSAPPDAGQYLGLTIPTPRRVERKALLREAGLRSGERLITVNGEPLQSLDGLMRTLEAAKDYLKTNKGFSITLGIATGQFESARVNIASSLL